jgi:hypothetical protein
VAGSRRGCRAGRPGTGRRGASLAPSPRSCLVNP